jgi:hypothetical protein
MADIPQPYFDPSQYPAYLDAQRKAQVAQMLMGSLQQANQTPADWNSMKVVPKRGMLQNVSVLADALLAKKGMDASNQATSSYMQGLYGGGQPATPAAAPASTGPGSGIISPDAPAAAQDAAAAVTAGQKPTGLVAPQPTAAPSNPLIPAGMPRNNAQMLLNMMGPEKYAETFISPQFKQPEIVANLRAAGIDPNSPQGQAVQQAIINKGATNLQEVKPGSTMYDVNQGRPVFTGPDNGINTTWGPDGKPIQALVPGAAPATQEMQKAKTTGTLTATPIKLGVDENGKDIYGYPAAPGAGSLNATAPGQTANPASVQSQKSGAEAGQNYASELAKNATGATEVRRSISELKNLSAQATPGAANEAKAKLGAFMIAAGADPDNVAKWTGVDTGALQAAQKQTATLAVNSIHSMTSRGTNFDLDTFMRNNPNMNMADPAAFARVADYMNNKAGQDIAKQKDFAEWKKTSGVSPDDWETQHTAHWLDKQNQDINAGKSNSRNPATVTPQHSLAELQAEARKRGLIAP